MELGIFLDAPGTVDALRVASISPPAPGAGHVLVRQQLIGVNYIDIYHRSGVYPLAAPFIPGVEAIGVLEAVGEGVAGLTAGQRVAYAGEVGSYATLRVLPAWRAVPVPGALDPNRLAGMLLRALTVRMLVARTYPVDDSSTVLVHSAAGGLGTILTRWVKHLGGKVIATVGTRQKAEIAEANGADHVIVGRTADFASEALRLTGGQGVDLAVDGVGGETLLATIACVRRFGMVASIGQSSGRIDPLDVNLLGPARSLSFSRPSVMAYAADRGAYAEAFEDVLAFLQKSPPDEAGTIYRLRDVRMAHADLEDGRTVGAVALRC